MRIECPSSVLAAALASAGRAASTKTTIPVLSHLLLDAGDGGVTISSPDMELSLRVPVPDATSSEGGAVALPRLAADIVRSMPEGVVSIEYRDGEASATIEGGQSRFSLNVLPSGDFPELPPDAGGGVTLPTEGVVRAIERVAKAASRDETRPVLTGVLTRIGPDGVMLVATDSYRLAVEETRLESPPESQSEAIIPARALWEIARLASSEKADELELVVGDSVALARVGGVRLTSRLIDGQFPDHTQLLPTEFTHDVAFERSELLAVLARIGVLAQRSSPVKLAFSEGQVTISTVSEVLGEARESVPVAFSGEDLEVGFNVEFLRAGVESVAGDELRLGLISPLRPGLMRGEDERFRYLLMPIRLNA